MWFLYGHDQAIRGGKVDDCQVVPVIGPFLGCVHRAITDFALTGY